MSTSTGEALRARIEANLARQTQPELAAIHLVRTTRDLTAAMPRFVTAFRPVDRVRERARASVHAGLLRALAMTLHASRRYHQRSNRSFAS